MIRYSIENEKIKVKLEEFKRINNLYDIRMAYNTEAKEFDKYVKIISNTVENKKGDSAAAAKDVLARGIAHGKRKNS